MENSENTKPKSLSELIKDAEKNNYKILLVGEDAMAGIGRHAALLAKMQEQSEILVVNICDLSKEDQDRVERDSVSIFERNLAFERPPIVLAAPPEPMPEIILQKDDNKMWYERFPKKLNKHQFRKK